jgi:hypothetical protein
MTAAGERRAFFLPWDRWIWQADWSGEDVGLDGVPIVGHYILRGGVEEEQVLNAYVDVGTGEILDWWVDDDR